MPTNYIVKDRQFKSSLFNGDDFSLNPSKFTTNLVANALDRMQVSFTLAVNWYAQSASFDEWTTIDLGGGEYNIIRQSGTFTNDNFKVGQWFAFRTAFNTGSEGTQYIAKIASISSNGLELTFDSVTSGTVTTGTTTTSGIRAYMPFDDEDGSHFFYIQYKFGISENENRDDYENYTTGEDQLYTVDNVGRFDGGSRNVMVVAGLPQNKVRSWITGGLTCLYNQAESSEFVQSFTFTHQFINPFYQDGENGVSQPDDLVGDRSFKYLWNVNLRTNSTNPNKEVEAVDNDNLGFTGYFDENFNGKPNDFIISNLSYQTPSGSNDGLVIQELNEVKFKVSHPTYTFSNDWVGEVSVNSIPPDFINTETDLPTNFTLDHLQVGVDGGTVSGSEIIKSISISNNANILDVTVTLSYTIDQQAKLLNGQGYFLSFSVENTGLQAAEGVRVRSMVDIGTFISRQDLSSLVTTFRAGYFPHNSQPTTDDLFADVGQPEIFTFVSNEIVFKCSIVFDVNNPFSGGATARPYTINSASLLLVSQDSVSGSFFELDRYNYNLSNAFQFDDDGVFFTSIQINDRRAYPRAENDPFGRTYLATNPVFGSVDFFAGQLIQWKDYQANPNVPKDVFFDPTQPNDNLNRYSSNYSGKLNPSTGGFYRVKCAVEMSVTTIDDSGNQLSGFVRLFAGDIQVCPFEIDCTVEEQIVVQRFQTFRVSDGIEVSKRILPDQPTLFRVTHEVAGGVGSVDDVTYAWHGIQVKDALGDQLFILSSLDYKDEPSNTPLYNDSGVLNVSIDGGNVVTECLIDPTKLSAQEFTLYSDIRID